MDALGVGEPALEFTLEFAAEILTSLVG